MPAKEPSEHIRDDPEIEPLSVSPSSVPASAAQESTQPATSPVAAATSSPKAMSDDALGATDDRSASQLQAASPLQPTSDTVSAAQEDNMSAGSSPRSPEPEADGHANNASAPQSSSPAFAEADTAAGFDADTAREAITRMLHYQQRAHLAEKRLAEALAAQEKLRAQLKKGRLHQADSGQAEDAPVSPPVKPQPLYNELGGIGYVYSSVYGVLPRIPKPCEPANDSGQVEDQDTESGQLLALQTNSQPFTPRAAAGPESEANAYLTEPGEADAAANTLAAAAAAAAAFGANHSSVKSIARSGSRAIPMLSALGSWEGLVNVMHVGTASAPALLDLEALHGHKWRAGSRSRWREVKVAWKEIQRLAGDVDENTPAQVLKQQYIEAARQLDKERKTFGPGQTEMGFPTHLKKIIMPKHRQSLQD